MKEKVIGLALVFLFLGVIVWQSVSVDRNRYILWEHSARRDKLSAINQKYFLRLKGIMSSEAMMRYASGKKYRFASASDIIITEQ